MTKEYHVAIAGATGYTGSELARILSRHPQVSLRLLTSESKAGTPFSSIYPQFTGIVEHTLRPTSALQEEEDLDLVFLALPHGVSMDFVRQHGTRRWKIIDLSGDFRLNSAADYKQWYGQEHVAPEALDEAVFGLPELFRSRVREARLIANPGCYPTSTILALAPLLQRKVIEERGIVVDSKSGVSGAGAKAKASTHFPEVFGNFKAYSLLTHRHTPEMEQVLSKVSGQPIELLFTPHLLPVDRGILTTTYSQSKEDLSTEGLQQLFAEFYRDEPFVRVRQTPPSLKDVRGSNFCDVFVTWDERTRRVLTVSVIDNLVKGAAGQAVQNMNLLFGLEERTGIDILPLSP